MYASPDFLRVSWCASTAKSKAFLIRTLSASFEIRFEFLSKALYSRAIIFLSTASCSSDMISSETYSSYEEIELKLLLACKYFRANLSKTDSNIIILAVALHDDSIAILNELSFCAVSKHSWLSSLPTDF